MTERPLLSVVTMASWGPAFPRVARWLGAGFRQVDATTDIVYLDQRLRVFEATPPSQGQDAGPGRVREIELGARRARSALPRLVGYLRDRRPGITLATPGTIGSLAVVAGALARCSVLPWEQTVPAMDRADVPRYLRPSASVSGYLYRRAPKVVAVSEGVRAAVLAGLGPDIGPERVVVVPNPIDAEEIRRLAEPAAPRSGRLRFCSIGRLVSAKGFDVLIEAVAIAGLGSDWELIVVGDGPLRRDLERLVAERGLTGHVSFLGRVDNPYPILASADVAVQASRWEGFGIAVLEALALGVPLVATSCPGGVAEILEGGRYGVLVPPDDAAALARTLRAVAEDRELVRRLARDGPERASVYAPVEVARRMVDLAMGLQGSQTSAEGPLRSEAA